MCPDGSLNVQQLMKWCRDYDQYKLNTGALLEWTCGLPARGTELTVSRFANDCGGAQRHVFIIRGYLCIHSDYNKSTGYTTRHKPILRAMPARMGEIVAMELMFVHSVRDRFYCALHGVNPPKDLFTRLFVDHQGREITSNQISSRMMKMSQERFGVRFGMNKWRHILIYVSRKICEPGSHTYLDSIVEMQSGHSRSVAMSNYARQSGIMEGDDERTLFFYLRQSQRMHSAFNLDRPNNMYKPILLFIHVSNLTKQ